MATEVWRDLGPVPGQCTVCGSGGHLTMGEVHAQRSLAERLRREHVRPPTRLVTCGGCGWRWTVRSSDTPRAAVAAVVGRQSAPDADAGDPESLPGVGRRCTDVPAPRSAEPAPTQPWAGPGRTAATWDILPCPRDRRRLTTRLR